jgi:hypothetical protein
MQNKYDHYIATYEIDPPIGGKFGWGAKANMKEVDAGRFDDFIPLRDHVGKTKEEAEAKAEAEAQAWIKAHTLIGPVRAVRH